MTDTPIPVSFIQHIDKKFDTHQEKIERLFHDHTRDELERYKEILNRISHSDTESLAWRTTFTESVNPMLTKVLDVERRFNHAFVLTPHGMPDFTGHAASHEAMIKDATVTQELLQYVKKVVLAAAATAVGSWVLVLVWNGVLHGPVK